MRAEDTKRKSLPSKAASVPAKSNQQTPVPVVGLPATLSEHGFLATKFADLEKLLKRLGALDRWGSTCLPSRPLTPEELAELRAVPLGKLKALDAKLDQPASAEAIAWEITRLMEVKAAAGTINQEVLGPTMCEDIAEMQPTFFELQRACAHVRRKGSPFISIVELAEAIENKQKRRRGRRSLLPAVEAALQRGGRDEEERLDPRKKERREARERKEDHEAAWAELQERWGDRLADMCVYAPNLTPKERSAAWDVRMQLEDIAADVPEAQPFADLCEETDARLKREREARSPRRLDPSAGVYLGDAPIPDAPKVNAKFAGMSRAVGRPRKKGGAR